MDRGIFLIGLFKLLKAVLLLALAFGALSVIHKDAQEVISYRIWELGADPEGRFFRHFVATLGLASPRAIELVSIGSFTYATIFGIEGIGLLMRKRWAEYLTSIVTASFIPIELYELSRHFTLFKSLVIGINIAIVVYLIIQLRKTQNTAV